MEVVEAAAAQLETLKFGAGVGPGQAVQSPGPVPDSETPQPPPSDEVPPPSDEVPPDTGQGEEAQLAGEQPPELALSAAVGGNPAPQSGPEPTPGGTCVTGPAAELVPTPDALGTSDSESDSDRSGACGSRNCLCNLREEPGLGGRGGALPGPGGRGGP